MAQADAPSRRTGLSDLDGREALSLVWGERGLVALVFAALLALGATLSLTLPKSWTARSSVLVRLGQDYVYEPRAGDAGRGAVPKTDEVVQAEAAILTSDEVKRRAARKVGLGVVDPRLARAAASTGDDQRVEAAAVKTLSQGLQIRTGPDNSVIQLSYRHPDRLASARILNAIIDAYVAYRREVLVDVTSPLLTRQKAAFERRLAAADAAYEAFLRDNAVGDFPSTRAAYAALQAAVLQEKFRTEAALRETRARLQVLSAGLSQAPAEIAIQRDQDLTTQTKLLQLRQERQDLLARYLPDAEPVRDLDGRIAQLEALAASGQGGGDKDRRLGANPVWQSLETERIRLQADAAAMADRLAALNAQAAQVSQRQLRLSELETQFSTLSSERDVLQASVKTFTSRAAENQAAEEMARAGDDSVRILERAQPPATATSLRRPALILAALFAAFTALCAGLVAGLLKRRTPAPAPILRRPAAAGLGLPVLAQVRFKGG